jgi:predicted ATPase/DNA-binding winged helix-turn-helix (wHTH) protein
LRAGAIRCGEVLIDLANRRFQNAGLEVQLEPRVFAVIAQLVGRPGELVTRNDLLDAVWGHRYVTPSALNRTIALARRAFGDEGAEPRHIQTVHGAGYRFVGPVEIADSGAAGIQARFAPPLIARLPGRFEALIGREEALSTLGCLLAGNRAVTVLGAGGMGKTECALEAAHRVAPDYPDGVWFFDLAPMSAAVEWRDALAAALSLPRLPGADVTGKICALLQGRQALLLLDNCDRIAVETGAIVVALLRGTDQLKVLATSQVPLEFSGEQLMPLGPLGLPTFSSAGAVELSVIGQAPAVELIRRRICSINPQFELNADNAAAIAEICQRLDGMPLALELAAARFALLSPEQVLERIEQRFRFLDQNVSGRDFRHRGLQSLLDWSYALLTADEQRLLNWCAVFVQTWTLESTLMLAPALGRGAEDVLDLLTGLVKRSLVSVQSGLAPPRYRLLETVRQYAHDRLATSGEQLAARQAHLQSVVHTCKTAHTDILRGRMMQCIERMPHEHGNISAALDTALADPALHTAALELVGRLLLYGKAHGNYTMIYDWCSRVLDGTALSELPERGRALLVAGVTDVHRAADQLDARTPLPEAARIAALNGDWWTEAYAFGYLAMGCANGGRWQEAEVCLIRTEQLVAFHADPVLVGLAGLARGWIALTRGDLAAALAALRAVRELGPDLHQHHFVVLYLGLVQFCQANWREAAREWLTGMRMGLPLGNMRGAAGSIEGCGYLCCREHDWLTAARMLAAAAQIREHTGIPLFRFWLPQHYAALEEIRAHIAAPQFDAAWSSGRDARQEVMTNEAMSRLQQIASTGVVARATV